MSDDPRFGGFWNAVMACKRDWIRQSDDLACRKKLSDKFSADWKRAFVKKAIKAGGQWPMPGGALEKLLHGKEK